MKLSIALCTYNGNRYLYDQLASIRSQTRQPDEFILRDDASTDGTLELAHGFAREMSYPVRIQKNAVTTGSTRNFAEAIAECDGDVIVLADQDDAWLPHKLARLEEAFQRKPEAAFAFSDAEIVDDQLEPLGYRLWDALQFQLAERRRFLSGGAFESLLRRYRVTGATMAFRAKFRDLVLPIPDRWVHDAWIGLILAAVAPCALIEEPLVRYRQHSAQQHGGRRRRLFDQFRAACGLTETACETVAKRYEEALERLSGIPGVSAERLSLLRDKIDHHRCRAAMREAGAWRLPRVVREAVHGRYARFGQGWKSIAQDLMLS